MAENLVEVVVLLELSLFYSNIIIQIFWNQKHTFTRLFVQVFILSVLNVFTSLVIGELYHLVYPEEIGIIQRIFISDFVVVSILTTTFFVYFLVSRHRQEEILSLQARLNNLAIQTDNHFIFNCFSTLQGMIRTRPDDAEKFLQELAEIFRFVVRNGNKHLVLLSEEIRFTDNYITLINYRYDGISVSIDDSLKHTEAYVFPVSIQQLVENAVKHNRHGRNNKLSIEVLLDGREVAVISESSL